VAVEAYGKTHCGLVRPHNEDAMAWDPELGLFVVADGMGGHNAGEVASALAVETICEFIERTREPENCTWPFDLNPAVSYDVNRVMNALLLANRRVFHESEARAECSGMGTTATVALIAGERLTFGGIGDSRLYALAGSQLTQLTVDDSWLVRMSAAHPSIRREELNASPYRNALTNVIGARAETTASVAERRLRHGDVLLLCSDGLHSLVDDEVIRDMLLAHPLDVVPDALVEAALARGGRDNVTALVVRYSDS
jgi:protein phosphatase